jgi:hypothetical protein
MGAAITTGGSFLASIPGSFLASGEAGGNLNCMATRLVTLASSLLYQLACGRFSRLARAVRGEPTEGTTDEHGRARGSYGHPERKAGARRKRSGFHASQPRTDTLGRLWRKQLAQGCTPGDPVKDPQSSLDRHPEVAVLEQALNGTTNIQWFDSIASMRRRLRLEHHRGQGRRQSLHSALQRNDRQSLGQPRDQSESSRGVAATLLGLAQRALVRSRG